MTFFDPNHPFYQKSLVFTGELSIDRREPCSGRSMWGPSSKPPSPGRPTSWLWAGSTTAPAGTATVSNKEEKARAILAEGKSRLRLLSEREFLHLLQGALRQPPSERQNSAAVK